MAKQTTHAAWHSFHTPQFLHAFQSSEHGLSAQEAKQRLAHFGPNILTTKKESWLKRIIEPFKSLFVIVLLFAIVISLLTHENLDALIIGFVVFVNATLFYFQQYSVSKVLKDLKSHEDGQITVHRNGQPIEISARDIVPGDIIFVFEGTKIPADGRVLEATNLQVNESMLTGESLPILKQTDVLPKNTRLYDQANMVFRGTFVNSGSGRFIVTATGNNTELGSITKLATSGDGGKTPIEQKIDSVTKVLVFGISAIGVVVFGLALLRGIAASEALRFTLSLIVSIVPEGLPVTLAVVLLFSARRMASRGVLVKNLASIETMGAVTLIATDKTGTLTENNLQIADRHDITGHLHRTASGSITVQNGVVLDSLDKILEQRFKHTSERRHIKSFPFDQHLRVSGALVQEESQSRLYIKGAPEAFLENLTPHQKYKAQEVLDQYTKKGFRTIGFGHAIATKSTNEVNKSLLKKVTFDGFVALADPLRKNIKASVAEAKIAGINVVMLTGDHANTAFEIARQAGIVSSPDEVANSKMLESPPNSKLMRTVLKRVHVFARVLPEHKFNFLKSIKKSEVTAMTGDGVNDIPALIEADAGLSMGSGTDAAKDASDMVLLRDNFSTIIEAVRLGRSVIANISKMLFYLISTSIGEAGTMIGALLLGLPLPVTAIHVLWINIVTDGFTVLPLGLSPPEKHQMKQPPRDPKAPLLSRVLTTRTILAGLVMAGVSLYVYNLLLPKGHAYAQTAVFLCLVVVQWANALSANFEHGSWVTIFTRPNKLLFIGIAASIACQAFAFFGPLRDAFDIVPLQTADLVLSILLPIFVMLVTIDAHKLMVALLGYTKNTNKEVV